MDKHRFAATIGLLALSLMGNASVAQNQVRSEALSVSQPSAVSTPAAASPVAPAAPAVQGTSVNSFFDSGAIVNPMSMEQASIPADQFVSLPPGHNIKAPKPGEKIKKNGFFSGVGRAFAHTCNFVGFPVGDDHDVDASLSSDLTNEQNKIKRDQLEAAQNASSSSSSSTK